jgi:hypothetical protein
MRLGLTLGLLVLVTGCAAPHSNGAAWAQQNLDAERVLFQLGDAQRAQLAQNFQFSLVDDALAHERQRITSALHACPGPAEPLQLSASDQLRDGMRIQAQSDPTRMAQIANVALADWFVRRAAATGNAEFCARATDALNGTAPTAQPDLLPSLRADTVSRNGAPPDSLQPSDAPALVALSDYALGYVDAVEAEAPLPQYLAGVYGGVLQDGAATEDSETALGTVDAQAAAYPQWEPDALYLGLRGGSLP